MTAVKRILFSFSSANTFRFTSNSIITKRQFTCIKPPNKPADPHSDTNVHPAQKVVQKQIRNSRSTIFALSIGIGLVSFLTAVYTVHSEENDLIRTMDLTALKTQIKAACMYPGVYIWGSNRGGLVQPGTLSKLDQPVSIEAFKGRALRDLAFGDTHAAAIDEHGNLLQWGRSMSSDQPKLTFTQHNLVKVTCASQKTYALSRNGMIYEIDSDPSYSKVTPLKLPAGSAWGERITSISCGSSHLIAVSNTGRAYSFACDSNANKCGQLGLGHVNIVDEDSFVLNRISGLSMCDKVAAGRSHSIIGTTDGRAFGFGQNRFGQLGIGLCKDIIHASPVQIDTIWSDSGKPTQKSPDSKCTHIAAGGDTTLFVVDTPKTTRVLASGHGQFGQLGTGNFNHTMATPSLIKPLSNLVEYDSIQHKISPIRVRKVCVGDVHCCVVMNNSIGEHGQVGLSGWVSGVWKWLWTGSRTKESERYGHDVLVWGMNMDGQLRRADSKKGSLASPGYMLPIVYQDVGKLNASHEHGHGHGHGLVEKDTMIIEAESKLDANDEMEENTGNIRLQLASKGWVTFKSGNLSVSQDIVLGPNLTAVYTRLDQ
ncbi:hypothetical protein BDV3_002207 [Batrachochytrium dendrobatidis]|uniref:Uncharacterized protein n=1 Tax=Batrachochytrium dendrobatidis (strain JEL423) TaxID=403673 RepID=A0A177WVY1_BATDL|nr:hypothetical protein BDEG_27095 [Batrachochytrium dendrobatidis JEL423]